jgi:hypothetical protein
MQRAIDSSGTFQRIGQQICTYGTGAPGYDPKATTSTRVWATGDLSSMDWVSTLRRCLYLGACTDAGGRRSTRLTQRVAISAMTHWRCMGAQQSMPLCMLGQNPGGGGTETIDPNASQPSISVQMTHKTHLSAQLRSVQPGNPSILVGFCKFGACLFQCGIPGRAAQLSEVLPGHTAARFRQAGDAPDAGPGNPPVVLPAPRANFWSTGLTGRPAQPATTTRTWTCHQKESRQPVEVQRHSTTINAPTITFPW